jgi:proteasome lid subunit RPN8/RPN11
MSDFAQWKGEVRALFNPSALLAARQHAVEQFPKESCGVIADGQYIPCFNYALNPETDFKIAPETLISLSESGRKVEAIVHSHPNGPMYPSENDMRGQITTDLPWIIVVVNHDTHTGETEAAEELVIWGDTLPRAPLLERPFVWGVFDCYSLVRDAFQEHFGKSLPAVPREDAYWTKGQDLYGDWLKKLGFQRISASVAKPGDCFLIALPGSPVPSHAGILLEGDMILHHLPNRLSRREPAGVWAHGADMWVRHPELNQDA